jgi:hypothetical protein
MIECRKVPALDISDLLEFLQFFSGRQLPLGNQKTLFYSTGIMFDSKLLEIVRVMTPREIADFKNSALYHDRRVRKEVIDLFEYILRFHPECNAPELSKENTHRHLYGDKPYAENRLNQLMSALNRLLESFIASHQPDEMQEISHLYALSEYFLNRQLPHRLELSVQRLRALLEEMPAESDEIYWQQFRVEYLAHLQAGLYTQKSADLNLLPVLESLERYYVTQRLVILAALLSHSQWIQVDTSRAAAIHQLMDQKAEINRLSEKSVLIRAYFQLLPLLIDVAGHDEIRAYRNMLWQHRTQIAQSHLRNLYTIVRNYLTRQYNLGNTQMLPVLFENLKEEDEQGFLCEDNGLYRASTFQNVVTVALKLRYFDWTRQFIEKARGRITGASEPDTVLTFNEANYFFHTQNYEAALGTGFHLLKYDHFIYTLAARRLEIMIWFEKNDPDMTEYRLNALKSFLFANKNVLPPILKKNNDDFVDVLRQMMSPRNKNSAKRRASLAETVRENKKNIAEREWILEKMAND